MRKTLWNDFEWEPCLLKTTKECDLPETQLYWVSFPISQSSSTGRFSSSASSLLTDLAPIFDSDL